MSYFAPYIDATGLHIPQYTDILNDLIADAQSIFGQDIYLGNDSADYQLLSVFALKISDTMQALVEIYNNRGPLTAVGSALDSIIKLNGLTRKAASYSTCEVSLTGTSGTVITNGVVQDISGYKWDLPASVTIGGGGTVSVTATCETLGAITAMIGDLSIISTPTAGWISVTNAGAATPGQPVESDSTLRSRQALSVSLPSQTMIDGTIAAIAATSGVTRYNIIENPTNGADSYGTPAHSLTAVVEGGTDTAIAQAIYNNRGIGCYTNGTDTVAVSDPSTGNTMNINFYRPTYLPIFVSLNVHGLTGFTSSTVTAIQTAIVNYLNSLQIGEEVTISALYGIAMAVTPNLSNPQFSIRALYAGTSANPAGTADISILFNQVSQGVTSNVVVTQI